MKPLYVLEGLVQEGKKRGKDLGFPTANISLSQKIPSGIYISLTNVEEKEFPSLTFIGEAKTFDETIYQAETYIFDFNKTIYTKWLSVRLVKKIRKNEKFISAAVLIEKMKEDEKIARLWFKTKKLTEK